MMKTKRKSTNINELRSIFKKHYKKTKLIHENETKQLIVEKPKVVLPVSSRTKEIQKCIFKVKFENKTNIFSPELTRTLWENIIIDFKCYSCKDLLTIHNNWDIVHLCDINCCFLHNSQFDNENELFHKCSRECQRKLKCVFTSKNMNFLCFKCIHKTFEIHYTQKNIFNKYLSIQTEISTVLLNQKKTLYQRLHQKVYLNDLLTFLSLSVDDVFEWLWEKWTKVDFKCGLCNSLIPNTTLYVWYESGKKISAEHFMKNVTVVCKLCKNYKKCAECLNDVCESNTVVSYKKLFNTDFYFNINYCLKCYTNSILYNENRIYELDDPIEITQRFNKIKIIGCDQKFNKLKHFLVNLIKKDLSSLQYTDKIRFNCENNNLMVENICNQLEIQKYSCCICFSDITWPKSKKCKKNDSDFSINRIFNHLPHLPDNVVITCWKCNMNYRTCHKCQLFSMNRESFSVYKGITYCNPCLE
jgi:hypothetical protein